MADDAFDTNSEESSGSNTPKWMTTFADLNSLLLCFFVLLFSFSNLDIQKYRAMVLSMQSAFGTKKERKSVFDSADTSLIDLNPESQIIKDEVKQKKNKDSQFPPSEEATSTLKDLIEEEKREIMAELDTSVRHLQLGEDVEISSVDRGVMLNIKGEILFALGKAKISPEGMDILDKIAPVIKRHSKYDIMIEGHTDNIPIHTSIFPSNWELSSARASTVVRALIQKYKLPPDIFTAVGYADTKPLVSNNTSKNRAKNRRVNFIFLIP